MAPTDLGFSDTGFIEPTITSSGLVGRMMGMMNAVDRMCMVTEKESKKVKIARIAAERLEKSKVVYNEPKPKMRTFHSGPKTAHRVRSFH